LFRGQAYPWPVPWCWSLTYHVQPVPQLCDIAINEDGRFTAPSLQGDKAAAAWKKYDKDLFQTARLVTSTLYINIMLFDYVRNIMNVSDHIPMATSME